ncbi:hypothetical protein Ciccas_002093 [Cichlidogyrus casuarinus]|uniref:Uncharacterized protein n=1 Tax=Cichlidogyrus casuarinus TaxID=1844966 RepID=A0ABD2QJ78_9PLAT
MIKFLVLLVTLFVVASTRDASTSCTLFTPPPPMDECKKKVLTSLEVMKQTLACIGNQMRNLFNCHTCKLPAGETKESLEKYNQFTIEEHKGIVDMLKGSVTFESFERALANLKTQGNTMSYSYVKDTTTKIVKYTTGYLNGTIYKLENTCRRQVDAFNKLG